MKRLPVRVACVFLFLCCVFLSARAGVDVSAQDGIPLSIESQNSLEAQLRYELAVNYYNLTLEELLSYGGKIAGIASIENPDDPDSIHNLKVPFIAIDPQAETAGWTIALPGDPNFNVIFEIPGMSERVRLMGITPDQVKASTASEGDYYLPYPEEFTYRVNSDFNDDRPYGKHNAVDFGLDEGDSVVAALGGEVIDFRRDSDDCGGIEAINDANFIKIYNADAEEYSIYYHFVGDSIPVDIENDDEIERGDDIGEAGHTGYTEPACTGDHLHFEVQQLTQGGSLVMVDPYFVENSGVLVTGNEIESQNDPEGVNVDVVLIIDSSGSMDWNDEDNKRLDAGKAYLISSLTGDFVGVVDFDEAARVASIFRELPVNYNLLKTAVESIDSDGGTDVGAGIQAACDEIRKTGSSNGVNAAILLTDGRNDPDPYGDQHVCFSERKWPIYTFGFGDADELLLQEIATATGGEYKRLPTSDLVCEFQAVRSKIAGSPPTPCTAISVEPEQTVQFPVNLLEWLLKATFSISWPGSDVELSLVSPSGRVINRDTDAPDVVHDLGTTYETYGISNPEPGEWQVNLYGADVPAGGEEVVFNYATIVDPSPEPEPPQDFAASDGLLIAQVRMTWTKSQGATYYEIHRSVPNSTEWEFLHVREGQYDFSDDSSNADGTILEYAVKACSNAGCSALSNSDTGYADMPKMNTIDNVDGDGSFIVSWIPATTASHHEIQESHNGGAWTDIYSGSLTSISQVMKTSGQWCYRARGYNGIQYYSPWTSASCTTVNPFEGPVNFYFPIILRFPSVASPSLLVNGNFEQGPGVGWIESSSNGFPLITNDFLSNTGVSAHSGTWAVWLGGVDDETSILSQHVNVQAGQTVLSYYYWIGSADACGFDFGGVFVNGTAVASYELCDDSSTGGWVRGTANLSGYIGQQVLLEFVVETDDSLNSNLFIDDVTLDNGLATDSIEPARDPAVNAFALKSK